jgi:hypothetical protein
MSFHPKWAARVARRLLPLSIEQADLAKALREWVYTGVCEDHGEPCEVCQMCGQEDLRYHFLIENTNNQEQLWVGSECITKFGVGAVDEDGQRVDGAEATTIVRQHRAHLIEMARRKRVEHAIQLGLEREQLPHMVSILNTCLKIHRRGDALSPKLMANLGWRLRELKVAHAHRDFRVDLRKGQHKDDVVSMEDFKVKTLLYYLTPEQRRRVKEMRKS